MALNSKPTAMAQPNSTTPVVSDNETSASKYGFLAPCPRSELIGSVAAWMQNVLARWSQMDVTEVMWTRTIHILRLRLRQREAGKVIVYLTLRALDRSSLRTKMKGRMVMYITKQKRPLQAVLAIPSTSNETLYSYVLPHRISYSLAILSSVETAY